MNIRPKIPTYLEGNKLWYQGLVDYDPSKYTYAYDTSTLVDGDMTDNVFNPWISNLKGYDAAHRYLPTTGHGAFGINKPHYNYTKGVEGHKYYSNFGKDLLDENGNFTETGLAWAKAVDALLPKGSLASFYDNNGNIRNNWTTQYRDAHGRSAKTFTNLKDYVNYVRNDQILGARHNVFLNKGKRYFYKDKDGNIHWVNPEDVSKYKVSEKPVQSSWNDDHTIYWDDYELTGEVPKPEEPAKPAKPLEPAKPTDSLEEFHKEGGYGFDWSKIAQGIQQSLPGLFENVGLGLALDANRRIFNEKLKGIRPNLVQPYLTHRQVVGDEATKLAYYRRGAEGISKAAQPFTADADRQMAYLNESYKNKNELQAQGDIADNQEIRRTSDESNQHLWANTQRRTEVANENQTQLNYANAAKHDLNAQYIAANHASWDNFLKAREYRARQQLERAKEYQRNIWAMQDLYDLSTNPELAKLSKAYDEAYDADPNSDATKKAADAYRAKMFKLLKRMYEDALQRENSFYTWFGKLGMKITRKKKDDLLYKSARDVVEHFRKMSKMSDDSTLRSRHPGSRFKLTSHPKKMQQGGLAPFVVYTPLTMGGETSTTRSSETGSSSSSKSDSAKETLDLVKNLFKEVRGLPVDANNVYTYMQKFFAKAKAFGTELSTDDIASMYLQSMQQINNLKHSQDTYEKARAFATQQESLNEFAVDAMGNFIVQDKDGKLSKENSWQKVLESGKNPLTNEQLLYMRAYDLDLAFYKGDNLIMNTIFNGTGINKIGAQIKALAGSIGSSDSKIDGITLAESNKIKAGLNILANVPEGYYKITLENKTQLEQVKAAFNFIKSQLSRSQLAILESHGGADLAIANFLGSQLDSTRNISITPLTGKASDKADKGIGDLSPSMAFFMGMGDRNTFVIQDKTSHGLKVNTNSMPLLDSSGHSLGPATLLNIKESMYGGQLDLNSATMGDVKIAVNGQNDVLISDGTIHSTELPIDKLAAAKGIIKPDLSFLKNIEKAEQLLRSMGITNRDNLTPEQIETINKVYRDNNLPIVYTQNKDSQGLPVLTAEYRRFAMFNGYATENAFEGDMNFNDGAIEIDDKKELDQFESMMQTVTKNAKYKLDRGMFSGTDLYKGVIYVPMISSTISALGGTGYKGSAEEYMTIDRLQQQRDNALRMGYNPGGDVSMLK